MACVRSHPPPPRHHDHFQALLEQTEKRLAVFESKRYSTAATCTRDLFDIDDYYRVLKELADTRAINALQVSEVTSWRSRAWDSEALVDEYRAQLTEVTKATTHITAAELRALRDKLTESQDNALRFEATIAIQARDNRVFCPLLVV